MLVVISVIALLAALSFPLLKFMTQSGQSAKCMANLKQLGIEINLYAA